VKARVHRILIIGTEPTLTSALKRDLLRASSSLTALELPLAAERQDLELTLTLEAPTAVFLETSHLERSLQVAHWIREIDHNLQTIGFCEHIGTEALLRLMRAGLREWLPVPSDVDSLMVALERIQAEAASRPPSSWNHGQLVSFLPAKPGSGTSTIAMHAARGCARVLGSRVLLMDLDLQCGVLGFNSKAVGGLSINEALMHAQQLDAALWGRLTARSGEFDLLPATAVTDYQPLEPSQLRRVFGFALGRYSLVLADLPGGLEPGTMMTLEQSSRIFLVCTTDLSCIHLARRKLDLFAKLGVADKVEVLVNRATFHFGLSEAGLVEILGRKPVCLLPNAFVPLQTALKDGLLMGPQTPYSQALAPVIDLVAGSETRLEAGRKLPRLLPGLSVSGTLERLRRVVTSFRSNGSEADPAPPDTPPAAPREPITRLDLVGAAAGGKSERRKTHRRKPGSGAGGRRGGADRRKADEQTDPPQAGG
jgi:pilus assembly protein CpaE